MKKTFNMDMNIVKAIGILAIVAGHTNWDIFGDLFINGAWHVPLFFFISGYFLKEEFLEQINLEKIKNYFKNTIFKYIKIFYSYHFLYGGVTWLIYLLSGKIYGQLPNLKNLTYDFFNMNPFAIVVPNWFLLQLILSLTFFIISYSILKRIYNNKIFLTCIFVIFGATAIYLADPNYAPSLGFKKVLIKTLISTFYIYCGYLYKIKIETKLKFNSQMLIGLLSTQALILIIFNTSINSDINNAMLRSNFSGLIAPFIGILFVIYIAKLISPHIKENSFIDKIGKNTLNIMENHVFIIFLISTLFSTLDGKPIIETSHITSNYYKMNIFKFFYTFSSIAICVYLGDLFKILKSKLKPKITTYFVKKFNEQV